MIIFRGIYIKPWFLEDKQLKTTKFFDLTNPYLSFHIQIAICQNQSSLNLNSTDHMMHTFKDATAQTLSCSIQEGIWSRALLCESL